MIRIRDDFKSIVHVEPRNVLAVTRFEFVVGRGVNVEIRMVDQLVLKLWFETQENVEKAIKEIVK